MLIRHFQNSDIDKASQLAKLTWGDFFANESNALQYLIYSFMVEYYDLNRKYSFSAYENELKGFVLAFTKNDKFDKYDEFKQRVQNLNSKSQQKIALNLLEYLEKCGSELKNLMRDDDIFLGLFVSIQKGCGKMLLERLIDICRQNQVKSINLWTDTTCDYQYYKKNNFILLKDYDTEQNGKIIKTLFYQKLL